MKRLALIYLCLFFYLPVLEAKHFSNQYIEFDMPNTWTCGLEGAEYVCQSLNAARKKEAIIVFTAKARGAKDSLDDYQAYLKAQKTFALPNGQTLVSEPKYAKVTEVNGQRWIDALHMASEVPGFYTRYVATVKEDLGIVVTLSVSRDSYSTYQRVFDTIISSIRVFRQKKATTNLQVGSDSSSTGEGDPSSSVLVEEDATYQLATKEKQNSDQSTKKAGKFINYILFAIIAVGLFLILKKKK
jgi:hypothetical protein